MAGSSVRNGNGGGMDDGLPAVSAGTSLSTRWSDSDKLNALYKNVSCLNTSRAGV
jgi:hypothetical protein